MATTSFKIPFLQEAFPFKPPSKELDPYLDAMGACILKFGWERTTVPDIAKQINVSRATIYRNVGSIRDLQRAYVQREMSLLVLKIVNEVNLEDTPNAIITGISVFVTEMHAHPIFKKLRKDEPEILSVFEVSKSLNYFDIIARIVAPELEKSMKEGKLANRDPYIIASGIMRLTSSLLVAPPREDIREFLNEVLLPALHP